MQNLGVGQRVLQLSYSAKEVKFHKNGANTDTLHCPCLENLGLALNVYNMYML